MQIVILELIIDPACSVAFEAEPAEEDVMKRPPRSKKDPLFEPRTIGISILQGVVVLLIVLAVFVVAFYGGRGEDTSRALAFTTMLFGNLALILSNRSWSKTIMETLHSPNPALWWIIALAVIILGLVLYLPSLQSLFQFGVLSATDLLLCLLAGGTSVLWFEALKAAKFRLQP